VLLPLLTLVLGGVLFGWAKPVPVNFGALRNPKKDMLWVALAGPASNLAMALGWALLFKLSSAYPENYFAEPLMDMAAIGIKINIVLLVLNLIPLPPLDGGRVAISLLPHRQAYQLSKIEPYGMFVLIVLAISPVLGWVLYPLVNLVQQTLLMIVGI
jgi:Zn-dependent protease